MKKYPAYKKVYDEIRRMIYDGVYKKDSLLPPEPELQKMFGVSRTTIRKAIEMLSLDGMLSVKQGFGTLVTNTNKKAAQNLNLITSVSQTLENLGYEIGLKSIYIEPVKSYGRLSEMLGVEDDTPLFCINRIQTANNKPVAIAKNYLIADKFPDIDKTDDKIVSLYSYLNEKYGISYTSATDKISACNASFEESQLLDVEPKCALITITRICYLNSLPVEIDEVKIIGEKYEFEVIMQGS